MYASERESSTKFNDLHLVTPTVRPQSLNYHSFSPLFFFFVVCVSQATPRVRDNLDIVFADWERALLNTCVLHSNERGGTS